MSQVSAIASQPAPVTAVAALGEPAPAHRPAPAVSGPAESQPARPPDPPPATDVAGAAERIRAELERRLAGHDVLLRHEESARTVVIEIRDRETGDLVYQIPPEELVSVGARLKELLKATGVLVDSSS